MRPLFVEFPYATADEHPIDLDDSGSEFMVGSNLLVAPNPSPDEIAPYEVQLPPGTWFDYWTGEQFERNNKTQASDLEQRDKLNLNKPLLIQPSLEVLPVYVRGGAIVPLQAVTESTEEKPAGPLTLRVYVAGDPNTPCAAGEVYADDGHTFGFRCGAYARVHVSCSLNKDASLSVRVAPQEGSFVPWWTQYRLEIYGWAPRMQKASLGATNLDLKHDGPAWSVSVPANPHGETIELR